MLWALSSALALLLWSGPIVQGNVDNADEVVVTAPAKTICITREASGTTAQPHIAVYQGAGQPANVGTFQVTESPSGIVMYQTFDEPAGVATCKVMQGPMCVAVGGTDESPSGDQFWVQAQSDDETPKVFFGTPHMVRIGDPDASDDVQVITGPPSRWIGVRMTPIPEPVAAHLGKKGIMIGNIVVDSPAADAGLQRYDIIVGFDGQKIDDMEDLVTAIQGATPGRKADVVVIRKASKSHFAIRPADRPEPGKWVYMYDEPAEDIIDHSVNLRGHKLQLGPEGQLLLEDLGQLHEIPDIMEKLQDVFIQKGAGGAEGDFTFDVELPEGVIKFLGEDDADVSVEVSIVIDDNGNVTTINRDDDGHIKVERNTDGSKEIREYDSSEEFKQDDPDGFKLFRRHGGTGSMFLQRVNPPADRLKKLQREYQIEIEKRLKDAEGRLRDTHQKLDRFKEARKRVVRPAPRVAVEAEAISVEIENGRISVTVTKGQHQATYRFDSKKEFRDSEPELYEKVRTLLD